MAMLINQYSFIVVGFLILVFGPVLTRHLFGYKWAAMTIALTFVSLVGFQLITSTSSDKISTPEDFSNALDAGKPVFLELYSYL